MIRNSHKLLILFFLFGPLSLPAQSKVFLSKIDTAVRAENIYITRYNAQSFFETGLADQVFDVYKTDTQLLIATVFFTINRYRQSKSLPQYKYSRKLEAIAFNYVGYKSRKRLEQNKSNYEKIAHDFPNIARYFDFRGKLLNFNTALLNAIDYTKNKDFYYDRKDPLPGLKLYYENNGNKNAEKELIPCYTYAGFAHILLNRLKVNDGVRNPKAKAYDYIGCYIGIDPKTLNRKRIPQAKVMVVYGGYRMKNIGQNK